MKKILVSISIFFLGFNTVEGLYPEPVIGIFAMPSSPFLSNFEGYNFYKSEPLKVVKSSRKYNDGWIIDNIEEIEYNQNIQQQNKIIHIRTYDKFGTLEDYYIAHCQFNNDNFVSMIVKEGDENTIITRKYADYINDRIIIRLYRGREQEMREKYIYKYNERGLLEYHVGESINPFSEKWEEDYIHSYFYDDQMRLVKIFYGSDRSSSTDIIYDTDNNITIGSGNDMYRAEYDPDGRIIYERWLIPPGGEVHEEIKTYKYSEGKIISILQTLSYDGEIFWSKKYDFEY